MIEAINDARNNLSQMVQYGNDWFSLKNLSWSKEYIKGTLGISLNFDFPAHGGNIYCFIGATNNGSAIDESVVVGVNGVDVCDLNNVDKRDKQFMFINNIKLVKCPQGVVPSFIWFNFVLYDFNNVRPSFIYFSVFDGIPKIVPVFSEREINILGAFSASLNKGTSQMIKCRSEIVDCGSDNEWDSDRELFCNFKPNNILRSIFINEQSQR